VPERELHPTLTRYTLETIPPIIAQQITDFVRIFWFEPYLYRLNPRPMSPTEVAWALVEENVLYAHSAVVFTNVTCNGVEYASGGLSAVLTYTWFRHRGFGSQVVTACNGEIDASNMDVAILWTDPETIPFYAQLGWEHLPTAVTVKGDPAAPVVHADDGVVMVRWVSEKGKAARTDFETKPIYIGKDGW